VGSVLGGARGRLIGEEMKSRAIAGIEEAVASGARLNEACRSLEISTRTFERWKGRRGPDRRKGAKKAVPKKMTDEERNKIIETASTERFRDCNPYEIVATLAGEDNYIGSESTIYRVLKGAGKLHYRGEAKHGKKMSKPPEVVATGPDQVWSWDITYMKSAVLGIFFYAYVIIDIWSRKIVGWAIHDHESPDRARELFASVANRTEVRGVHLRSDNGNPMKGMTMLAMLYHLGITPSFSRPRVSNDNPFIESYFKTLKYTVGYPGCFESLEHARKWMANFVDWYNTGHMHSKIGYVTPMQRHEGSDRPIFETRNAAMEKAYCAHPERWSRHVRTWGAPSSVALNAARHPRENAA
jgi:putative transposase